MELPKNYDFKESEKRLRQHWEQEDIYRFNPDDLEKPVYSIDTPPPTMSGKMHLGHSFSYSQQDFVARYKRMRGFNVFYPFGVDDNGLATERMIEQLKQVKSRSMPRDEFIALCLKTVDELQPGFIEDWKRIGISCDFSIFYSTIGDHSRKISQRSFIELYTMGRIKRELAPIMWCPSCQTAIAQVELKDKEFESTLNHIKLDIEGSQDSVVIATTRPELMPACVGVSVHPKDKRYKKYHGKKVKLPIYNRSVPIIPDEYTDMEYGTGVVYYCTYGGVECIDWMLRHPEIKAIDIMNPDGTLKPESGILAGLKSEAARKKILEELQKTGHLVKSEPIKHVVNTHERCGTQIEYIRSEQWYVRYLDLKKEFLKAGRKLKWYPKHMRARYDNWVKGLRWDWCISRQRYFGVPFPLWYCKKCNEVMLAEINELPVDPLKDKPRKACKCGSNEFIPEKDVFDTWATSSLTPQIAIELFKDKPIYSRLFPMSLRPQAHDIITFWLFYTVVKSQLHYKTNPWHDTIISGHALDPHGKKMSKSLGNVINPQDVIEKFGADALRFWAAGSKLGDDLPYQEKDLMTGQRFATKLWNASKFALSHLEGHKPRKTKLEAIDAWLLSKLHTLILQSTKAFDKYEYYRVKADTEQFFWHILCDNYLEIVKDRLYNKSAYTQQAYESARFTLYHTLLAVLKLMAPFTPFITDEVYQLHFAQVEGVKSVHSTAWPKVQRKLINAAAAEAGDIAVEIIAHARKAKSEKKLSMAAPAKKIVITTNKADALKALEQDIKAVLKAEVLEIKPGTEKDLKVIVEL
ncbi:valine--tRNA ligase [Candidatus Woesearchaeota archaeon]|nr:valine--tRNA ligase [Candidatus Woesearchaeota archaeon]